MLKIKSGYVLRSIVDEWLVFPVSSASISSTQILALNESGAFLWEQLTSGAEREQLADRLIHEFDIDYETAIQDIDAFVQKLDGLYLLTH